MTTNHGDQESNARSIRRKSGLGANPLALLGAITGVLGLISGFVALGWNVYTWKTERQTRIQVDLYPINLGEPRLGYAIRVRNRSDHRIEIDQIRLEWIEGGILRQVALVGKKLPGAPYVRVPGSVDAHSAGATYVSSRLAATVIGKRGSFRFVRAVATEASDQRPFPSAWFGLGIVRPRVFVTLDKAGDVPTAAGDIDILRGWLTLRGSTLIAKITVRRPITSQATYSTIVESDAGFAMLTATRDIAKTEFTVTLPGGRRVLPATGSIRARIVTMSAPASRLGIAQGDFRYAFEATTFGPTEYNDRLPNQPGTFFQATRSTR
jgi:hypothetical protein